MEAPPRGSAREGLNLSLARSSPPKAGSSPLQLPTVLVRVLLVVNFVILLLVLFTFFSRVVLKKVIVDTPSKQSSFREHLLLRQCSAFPAHSPLAICPTLCLYTVGIFRPGCLPSASAASGWRRASLGRYCCSASIPTPSQRSAGCLPSSGRVTRRVFRADGVRLKYLSNFS